MCACVYRGVDIYGCLPKLAHESTSPQDLSLFTTIRVHVLVQASVEGNFLNENKLNAQQPK